MLILNRFDINMCNQKDNIFMSHFLRYKKTLN